MTQALRKLPRLDDVISREAANAQKSVGANASVLGELSAHGFTDDEIYALVIPRRTLARRRRAGERLSLEESGRAFRVARITAHAERVFGDHEKAHRWLRKSSRTLNGSIPLELLTSEGGAHLVEQTLYRIEHGMLA